MLAKHDPFVEFRAAVSHHFVPVAKEFDLAALEERLFPGEIHIEFRGPATSLHVSYALGSTPWVYVGFFSGGRRQDFGLHTLVEDAEGSFEPVERALALPTLDAQIAELAALAHRHGAALLKGDGTRLAELRRLQAMAHRERNRRETGSVSRVEVLVPRPTLPQLFATAHNAEFPADVRMNCVYQAVWDYGYAVDEVGLFLGLPPHQVQRIVDSIDNVTEDLPDLAELRRIIGTGR